jgi:hypothetical protein
MKSGQQVAAPAPLDAADIEWVVAQAGRAPSIHNSQPWWFGWDGTTFTLLADTTRGLTVTDPDSRELVVSCGAALFNLRLALRKLGRDSSLQLLPDATDPRVLASVEVIDGMPATQSEVRLIAAIMRRHTHRGGFDDRPVGPGLAVRLQQAAAAEGAELHYVHDPGPRGRIEQLTHEAQWVQSVDRRVREELEEWTPSDGSSRRDGIPASTYPAGRRAGSDNIAARDFDAGRGIGSLDVATPGRGLLAILTTAQDLQRDWLQAGMSLGAVLTVAAEQWVFAALHSQVIEVAPSRSELRRELVTSAYPQLVLEFGHASLAPVTPRRRARDLVGHVPELVRPIGTGSFDAGMTEK